MGNPIGPTENAAWALIGTRLQADNEGWQTIASDIKMADVPEVLSHVVTIAASAIALCAAYEKEDITAPQFLARCRIRNEITRGTL